MDCFRF